MDLPETVLKDLAWAFKGSIAPSQESFCEKAAEYQRRIAGNDSWDPSAIVLPVKRVKIVYSPHFLNDDMAVDLTADSDVGFSAGELLYKLHNAVVDDLEHRDHRFFEGLTLNSWPVAQMPAIYIMRLGS